MLERNFTTFEAAEQLLLLMIDRACGNEVDVRAYREARKAVLRDERAARFAPKCVRLCRDPGTVWSYVKARELPSYESRRQHFRAEFEPLLSALETFESSPLNEVVSGEAEKLDSASVNEAWRRALERAPNDPAGAITAARSLLESVCKTILDDLPTNPEEPYEGLDLPALYRRVAAELRLAPADHSDEAIRRILGGCANAVNGIAGLRNLAGDSHGAGRRPYRPSYRHAALAVNMAGTMALFLMQTAEPVREYWEGEARQVLEAEG